MSSTPTSIQHYNQSQNDVFQDTDVDMIAMEKGDQKGTRETKVYQDSQPLKIITRISDYALRHLEWTGSLLIHYAKIKDYKSFNEVLSLFPFAIYCYAKVELSESAAKEYTYLSLCELCDLSIVKVIVEADKQLRNAMTSEHFYRALNINFMLMAAVRNNSIDVTAYILESYKDFVHQQNEGDLRHFLRDVFLITHPKIHPSPELIELVLSYIPIKKWGVYKILASVILDYFNKEADTFKHIVESKKIQELLSTQKLTNNEYNKLLKLAEKSKNKHIYAYLSESNTRNNLTDSNVEEMQLVEDTSYRMDLSTDSSSSSSSTQNTVNTEPDLKTTIDEAEVYQKRVANAYLVRLASRYSSDQANRPAPRKFTNPSNTANNPFAVLKQDSGSEVATSIFTNQSRLNELLDHIHPDTQYNLLYYLLLVEYNSPYCNSQFISHLLRVRPNQIAERVNDLSLPEYYIIQRFNRLKFDDLNWKKSHQLDPLLPILVENYINQTSPSKKEIQKTMARIAIHCNYCMYQLSLPKKESKTSTIEHPGFTDKQLMILSKKYLFYCKALITSLSYQHLKKKNQQTSNAQQTNSRSSAKHKPKPNVLAKRKVEALVFSESQRTEKPSAAPSQNKRRRKHK